jgi:hypothetical protein
MFAVECSVEDDERLKWILFCFDPSVLLLLIFVDCFRKEHGLPSPIRQIHSAPDQIRSKQDHVHPAYSTKKRELVGTWRDK